MRYKILADQTERKVKGENWNCQAETGRHQIEIRITGKRLVYVFPGREFVKSEEECEIICNYGTMIPASFFLFLEEDSHQCLTIIADSPTFQMVRLEKKGEEIVLQLRYDLEKAEEIRLKIYNEEGIIDTGVNRYRSWYTQKYGRRKKNPFAGKFHLRRYFFNKDLCPCTIMDDERITLKEQAERDKQVFGGVDMGLLFDPGYNPENGIRCGNEQENYIPDAMMKELIRQMKELKMFFFLYFDPWLIDRGSDWDQSMGDRLPVRNEEGEIYHNWRKNQWHPDIGDEEYQQSAGRYLQRLSDTLQTEGIYLDELGHGSQYPVQDQVQKEKKFVQNMRRAVPWKRWMCEFPPADCMNSQMDVVLSDTATLVNSYRFLFPEIKFIRIINCDRPIGNNVWAVNKSFFNGEGLWLDHDPESTAWYSQAVKETIREQYQVQQSYAEIFDSMDVQMLYPICGEQLLCNRFQKGDKQIFTVTNPGENCAKGELMIGRGKSVRQIYGKGEWTKGKKTLQLELGAKEVAAFLVKTEKNIIDNREKYGNINHMDKEQEDLKMKRTFISAISLQAPAALKEIYYHPVDFTLKHNKETRFPIIPIVQEYKGENPEDVCVIAIRPMNVDTEDNYRTFKKELTEAGVPEENIIDLQMRGDQSKKNSIRLLLQLLDAIPDDTLVYSDITYNTKPMSAMVLYAMRFVEKVKDAEVQGIYYGEIPRVRGVVDMEHAALYDITTFKYLSDLTDTMEQMGVRDLRAAIGRLTEN